MSNFEKVFETCVNTIHNKSVEDAKNEMYAPVEGRTTCYTLNSTADVIRKTVKVLYGLGLDGFPVTIV